MHKARYGFIFLKARQSTDIKTTKSKEQPKTISFKTGVRKSPIIDESKNTEHAKHSGRLLKTLIVITPSPNNRLVECFFVAY